MHPEGGLGGTVRFSTVRHAVTSVAAGERHLPATADCSSTIGADTPGCGPYTANGEVYGGKLYFTDDANFEAGFSNSGGADCVGIIVVSWSSTKVVLRFGNAYGTFDHWYLTNGDGYAISIKSAIWGGTVSGLS